MLARQINEHVDPDSKAAATVARIAAEFGVSRPTTYRYLYNYAELATPAP